MGKHKKDKVVMRVNVSQQDLATARFDVASAILESPNAQEILLAMQQYVMTAALSATNEYHLGKKKKAKQWKLVADEVHTIFSCAILNAEDRNNSEFDSD